MNWESSAQIAIFQKRYKRFFADIEIDGQVQVAHVANTGSLKTCLSVGAKALVLPATNPERKLRWSLVALETPSQSWVGIDTSAPNRLLAEVATSKKNKDWKFFSDFKSEVKISKESRLDGLLSGGPGGASRYLEVKNVTYAVGDLARKKGQAQFPDAVTERGQKHLRELMRLMQEGFECELIFAVQRLDCTSFAPADDIDPEYGKLLREAKSKGLIISPWVIQVSESGVQWAGQVLPVEL